jgi:prolyl oligopeptidase
MPRSHRLFPPVLLSLLLLAACGGDPDPAGRAAPRLVRAPVEMPTLEYPPTRTVDHTDDYHGTTVADPYRWLEDVDSEETAAWVAAQNAFTFGFLESIGARETFRERLTELWDYEKFGTPFREGGRTFWFRNDGLQNQSVLYVQDDADAEPRVLLDPNALSEDGTVALGGIGISRDGRHLAWATSVSGSDWRTWFVRDIATGEDLDDRVEWSKFSDASWDAEGEGFFYSRYPAPREGEAFEESNKKHMIYYHRLGTDQAADELVYDGREGRNWILGGEVSEDGRYLVISVWPGSASERGLFYLDLEDPAAGVVELLGEFDAIHEFVGNDGATFFVKTNRDAPKYRLVAIDLGDPGPEAWRTLIPEGEDPLDGVAVLNHEFVVTTMRDVASVVKRYRLDGTAKGAIELPGLGTVSGFAGHPGDTETFYSFNSFLSPGEIYRYDFRTGASELFRKPEVAFDFASCEVEQVFYPSRDGTRVPMFLVHRRDLEPDGANPTLLYAYGGFNQSLKPRFRPELLPWLEAGGIYASANLRGGGEYGEKWHQAGMLDRKQNVFDDFIAAAEFLIREGYTNPNRLAIYGGSNGGLLVGAVVNQRPELFGAAIPAVGVMDMLRFQEFTIGWAWTGEYGSSADPDMFPVLYGYSPYHNLKNGVEYPAVMVTTADHDDRVVPGHSFKYAARLQAAQAGNLPVLIRIQTRAGHGAGKPTAMVIEETADRYAFLHAVLGLDGL